MIGGGGLTVFGVLLAVALFRGFRSPLVPRRVASVEAVDDAALADLSVPP